MANLSSFLKDNDLNAYSLSRITGLSFSFFYQLMRDPLMNISIETINRIYETTKNHLGTGLTPDQYLDTPLEWMHKIPTSVDNSSRMA